MLGPVRHLLALAVAAVLLGCAPAEPGTTPTLTPPTGTPPADTTAEIREMERSIAELINDERREHGLDALETRDDLAAVARDYSQRMLDEGFFAHVDPQGEDVADRVREAGITFMAVGENLYFGSGPVDHVQRSVEGWMESEGHRENILRDIFSHTGVGLAREGTEVRITQIFLTP